MIIREKKRALIYGAGKTGEKVYRNIRMKYDVIGFLDTDSKKKGMLVANSVEVLGGVDVLDSIEYDVIIVASLLSFKEIEKTLIAAGVKRDSIEINIPEDIDDILGSPVRNTWLECYAELHNDWKYAVAEGGVFRGGFSAVINRCFPNSKLYLFDTFESFDNRDLDIDRKMGFSDVDRGAFTNTSVEIVLSKLEHKENVEIHKGFFPETAKDVSDTFCFVNLDFDLYQPILEGLRFFYPQMVNKSIILIHDYYDFSLPGVKQAIEDYEKEIGHELIKFPIGDNESMAILKE